MFKVGDRVRCVEARDSKFRGKELELNKVYTISNADEYGYVGIKELENLFTYSNRRFEKVNTEESIFNQYKCKFKVGDRVKRTNGQFTDMKKGDIGTIIGIGSFVGSKYPPSLTFKEFKGVHDSKNFELYKTTREEEIKLEIQKLQDELKKIEDNKEVLIDLDYCLDQIVAHGNQPSFEVKFIRKGRVVTCILYDSETEQIYGKGIAKACPEDTFNDNIGINLSYNRAFENYHKRIAHKIIKETF